MLGVDFAEVNRAVERLDQITVAVNPALVEVVEVLETRMELDCFTWSGVTLARDLGDGCRSPR